MKSPEFWFAPEPGLAAMLLTPASWLYGVAVRRRLVGLCGYRPGPPVICVGNLTLGGGGKTPLALDIAARLIAAGHRPHFLSRGHGGRLRGPTQVDVDRHSAADVGDEPLLLARVAPAWIARDRAAGAAAAAAAGASHIVMDDGFQNPALAKDISILAVDAGGGFGNGKVFPAGPLRERITDGLARADAVVVTGQGDAPGFDAAACPVPVLRATPVGRLPAGLTAGMRVVAFCGIARPAKFFATVRDLGLVLDGEIGFSDHHMFADRDLSRILAYADTRNATLVTTEKDFVRLPETVRPRVHAIPIALTWGDSGGLDALLSQVRHAAK